MSSTFARTLVVVVLLTGLTGCQTMEDLYYDVFGRESGSPSQVSDLVGSIERVYVDSELAKEKVQGAIVALQGIVASDFQGDAVSAYAIYVQAVERSEEQAEKLEGTVEEMKDAAEPVFEQWHDDLKAITNVEMRQRSRKRLMATRERYDAIVAAVEPAQHSYEEINELLRDHALFLGNDFNPASVAHLQEEVRVLTKQTAELDRDFDACLVAARKYIDATALPASSQPAAQQEQLRVGPENQPKHSRAKAVQVSGTRR
ncbi:MAG: DUF2959 family protein [Planctomycetota bacterium]|nr:DUF2959 family protein [Planctomycetota bacterium]